MVNFNIRGEKYDIDVLKVFVVLANLVFQNVSKFYQCGQVVVLVWIMHVEGKNVLNRFVIWLFDCKVLAINDESKTIETFSEGFFAEFQNGIS